MNNRELIYAYLQTQGVAETKLSEAADGISRTLQQIADPGMEGLYQKPPQQLFDFGNSLTPEKPTKNKAPARTSSLESQWRADCATGLAGDVEALGRAIEAKGRASSILPHLLQPGLPHWDVRGFQIDGPKDIAALLMPIRSPYFESLKVAVLDKNSVIQHSEVVTVGSLNESIAHPRDILRALRRLGEKSTFNSIILAHNHPSGDPSPSEADRRITRNLQTLCSELGYTVLDHVITNGGRFFSFREAGILPYGTKHVMSKGVGKIPPSKTPTHQPGSLAPWELVARDALQKVDNPEATRLVVQALRSAPTHGHVLYLSTRYTLLGVERISSIMDLASPELHKLILNGVQREGAYAFVVDFGHAKDGSQFLAKVRKLHSCANMMQVNFLDAMDWDAQIPSAKERGMLEVSPLSWGDMAGPLAETLKGAPIRSAPAKTAAAASL